MVRILCLFITLFFFKNHVISRTIYVDSAATGLNNGTSWVNAYKYLNTALQAIKYSNSIDSVLIAKGTYYPTGVQNGTQRDSTFGIFRTGIMLFGGYPNGGGVRFSGDGATILSANIGNIQDSTDNSYHVVVVTGVNSDIGAIRLDGLTIKDAFVNRFDRDIVYYNGVVDTVSSRRGGGIAIQNNHANFNIEIYNCKVTNNLMNMGAGLYVGENLLNELSLTIDSCWFTNNKAVIGSAIKVSEIKNFVLKRTLIQRNYTPYSMDLYQSISSVDEGGPVIVSASSAKITESKFLDNQNFFFSGLYVDSWGNDSVVLRHCEFQRNQTRHNGGSVVYINTGLKPTVIESCLLANNSVDTTTIYFNTPLAPIQGGSIISVNNGSHYPIVFSKVIIDQNNMLNSNGLISILGKANFMNCIFSRNVNYKTANNPFDLHTLFCGGATNTTLETFTFTNCTFYNNNHIGHPNDYHYRVDNAQVKFQNCLIWEKTRASTPNLCFATNGGSYTITNTNIPGSYAGPNNSGVYPMFQDTANILGVDGKWATADDGLNLLSCSNGINSGNITHLNSLMSTDIKGDPRVQFTYVDRGAYEANSNSMLSPSVSIHNPQGNTACIGVPTKLTAIPYLGGNNPSYQWKVNGNNVGTNSSTLFYSLSIGDIVTCVMTSNQVCVTPTVVTSAPLHILQSTPSVAVSNQLQVSPSNIVSNGQTVNFTSLINQQGNQDEIHWFKNNVRVMNVTGQNWAATAGIDFVDGDVIQTRLASSIPCAIQDTVWSNALTMAITNSIEQINALQQIIVYPNPATNTINVVGLPINCIVQVYNGVGQLIHQENTVNHHYIMNIERFVPGVYHLKIISSDGNRAHQQIVKW